MQNELNNGSAGNGQVEGINIPILTYHSIDESGSVISTSPDIFRRQMGYLSETNYNVVSLKDFVCSLVDKTPISAKTVVLTFDDGFQNFYSAAFPTLAQFKFKATVFLVTDYCDKYNDWAGNPKELPRSKLLSWQQIRELNDSGINFGSHSRSHPDLRKMPPEQVRNEMAASKLTIEDSLGCEVTTFAYPYGSYNTPVKKIAEETFSSACSTKLGKVRFGSDPYSLERVDTYYLSNEKIFNSLSSKSFDRYLKIRRAMRDFKALINRN